MLVSFLITRSGEFLRFLKYDGKIEHKHLLDLTVRGVLLLFIH